jgi:hypothetical protein
MFNQAHNEGVIFEHLLEWQGQEDERVQKIRKFNMFFVQLS